jgi:hypothetical protein
MTKIGTETEAPNASNSQSIQAAGIVPAVKRPIEISTIKAVPAEPRLFRGLCINCDVRHTCMFPRPEEGVWHCEEYV